MGVGARACPSCRSVFLDLCAPCAGKRCPKCTKSKLAERDSVFPYSLFRAISEEDDYKINSLLNRAREALDEITDQQGETPLAVAARSESSVAAERLCKLLMERGASADARLKSGRTALMEMIRNRGNYYSKVAALLRGSVNAQDNAGMTALMFAAEGVGLFGSRRGNMTAIRDLISLGADPSLEDGRGLTALGHAIASNDTEMNQPAIDYLKEQMVQRVALREFDRSYAHEFDGKGCLTFCPVKQAKASGKRIKAAAPRSRPSSGRRSR